LGGSRTAPTKDGDDLKKNENNPGAVCFSFAAAPFLLFYTLAYIDPTTTAMLTQIIAGIFISLGLALGIFRQKVVMFFRNLKVMVIRKKIEKESKRQGK